jgi:signal transduction histidine kinase
VDVLLAAIAAGALIVDGMNRRDGAALPAAGYILALVACAPLVWRREAPLAVLLAVQAGVITCVAVFHPHDAAIFPVMVALYTVAEFGGRRRSLLVGAMTAVVVVIVIVIVQHGQDFAGSTTVRLLVTLGALVVGDSVRTRRALAEAARERLASEAREREAETNRRLEAERLGIARELHDTIAHALVAINVRAGVAAHLGPAQDDAAALTDIKEVSARALGDLRATLRLLRDEDDVAPTRPAPDLGALPHLIETARSAGIDAVAMVDTNGKSIPSVVEEAGYRIVQESLTNIMRHSGASAARVDVRLIADRLKIQVTDNGRGGNAAAGHGLQGIAERAKALGGRMNAGPREHGGWRVTVYLPLSQPGDL